MREGWELKKLEEIFDVKSSKRVHKADWQTNGIPFYRAREVVKLSKYGTVENDLFITPELYLEFTREKGAPKEGDIIISAVGTLGQCYLVKKTDKFYFKDASVLWFDKTSPVDSKYIEYSFMSDIVVNQVMAKSMGATVGTLTISRAKNIEIPLPPLPEQQRIVAILDEAFAAIAKAKANAEQNLKNAKELFESYLQGVFENKSEGWEEKKWGDLCHFVRGPFGGSLKKSMFKETGYVVYEQKHAIHDHFNQLRYFIDEQKFNEMKRFEVKAGDIIMSCSGVTLGRVAIIPIGIPRGIINQALLKLTPNKDISVDFLKFWLRSGIFQRIIFEHSGGAAIPNVPAAKVLKEIVIPLPKLKKQNEIVNNIELMLNQTKKAEIIYQQKINNLEELKKSILNKAFKGEL